MYIDENNRIHLPTTTRIDSSKGRLWNVQTISSSRAKKTYLCPGCNNTIKPLTKHLVVWELESILGDEYAVNDRRHWHTHCWDINNDN